MVSPVCKALQVLWVAMHIRLRSRGQRMVMWQKPSGQKDVGKNFVSEDSCKTLSLVK